jgi:hypothetical protein
MHVYASLKTGEQPTFGPVPASLLDEEHQDQPAVVGHGAIIPRWHISPPNPTQLLYFVKDRTFPSVAVAKDAGQALQEAANERNNLRFAVIFEGTTTEADANFNLVYRVNQPGEERNLALSLFRTR